MIFGQEIVLPSGDGGVLEFTVRDNDGDLFDLSTVNEIVFIVADAYGGTVRIEKKYSAAQITIDPNLYQFRFNLLRADTSQLINQSNYYECTLRTSTGFHYTVAAGLFKAYQTMNKDLP